MQMIEFIKLHKKDMLNSNNRFNYESKNTERMFDILDASAKYILDAKSLELINELAYSNYKTFAGVRFPVGITYVELPWVGKVMGKRIRTAYCFWGYHENPDLNVRITEADLQKGQVAMFFEREGKEGSMLTLTCYIENLTPSFSFTESVSKTLGDVSNPLSPDFNPQTVVDVERCINVLWAFCMLMSNPALVTEEKTCMDKLNKSRAKSGKPLLSDYTRIKLTHSDAQLAGHRRPAVGESTERGKVRRHLVRHFIRVRNGKLELVRPHWRGSIDNGVKPSYNKIST